MVVLQRTTEEGCACQGRTNKSTRGATVCVLSACVCVSCQRLFLLMRVGMGTSVCVSFLFCKSKEGGVLVCVEEDESQGEGHRRFPF